MKRVNKVDKIMLHATNYGKLGYLARKCTHAKKT